VPDALEGLILDAGKAALMEEEGNRQVAERYSWTSFTRVLSSQIAAA